MTTLSLGRNELAFDDRPYTCTSVEGFELGVCEAPDHNDSLEDYFDINPFGLDQWENLQRPEPPGSMAYTNLDSSGIAVTLKQTTRALQDGSRAAGATTTKWKYRQQSVPDGHAPKRRRIRTPSEES
jgi:hypothetical protein